MKQLSKQFLLEKRPAAKLWTKTSAGLKSFSFYPSYLSPAVFYAACIAWPSQNSCAVYASLVFSDRSNRLTVSEIPLETYVGFELVDNESGEILYSNPTLELFFLYDNLSWLPSPSMPTGINTEYSYTCGGLNPKIAYTANSPEVLKFFEHNFPTALGMTTRDANRYYSFNRFYYSKTDNNESIFYCRLLTNSYSFKLNDFIFNEYKVIHNIPSIRKDGSDEQRHELLQYIGSCESGTEKTYKIPNLFSDKHWMFILSLGDTDGLSRISY